MEKLKSFIGNKGIGFWFSAATAVLALLGLIFFVALTNVSYESSETPALVIVCAVLCLAFSLITAFKDVFKVASLASFIAATITLCLFVAGRVSYLAYYFSGDVMNTGLSPLFVLAAICFILAVITSACSMFFKQEKIILKETA